MSAEPPLLIELRRVCRDRLAVVGHRGKSETHPENTLTAFRAALRAGADAIEFDTRPTRDGALVCMHDLTLGRTTDARPGTRRVTAATLAALRRLDAGRWKAREFARERVPTLGEALRTIAPTAVPMIERKGGSAAAYVALLREMDLVDRVILQAFDWRFVRRVRQLEPRLLTGALGQGPLGNAQLARIAATGAHLVHWEYATLAAEDVTAAHARGLLVCVYTANSDAALLGCAALGVDLITTNRPDRLRWLLGRFPAATARTSVPETKRPLARGR